MGTILTNTTLGPGTHVEWVDMVSVRVGFGIADAPNSGERHWTYLVETKNLGNSWDVRGVLPFASNSNYSLWAQSPTLHFVNQDVGYASVFDGPLYVTNTGGITWAKVQTPGVVPTYAISGSIVSIVSDIYAATIYTYLLAKCASDLSQYRVGATRPLSTSAIPAIGAGKWRAATMLAAPSPTKDRKGGCQALS